MLRKARNVKFLAARGPMWEQGDQLTVVCQSVERLDQDKDADKNVDADQTRTVRHVQSAQSIGLFIEREEMDIDFRVSGLPHAVVKQAEKPAFGSSSRRARVILIDKLFKPICSQPIQWWFESDDSWLGQCRVIRVMRNNSKSAMLRMPSFLESSNRSLHLWTSREKK